MVQKYFGDEDSICRFIDTDNGYRQLTVSGTSANPIDSILRLVGRFLPLPHGRSGHVQEISWHGRLVLLKYKQEKT
jgi:hypothetical protein